MITIKFDDLIIAEDRQRSKFNEAALGELAESIKANGILHPPVVRQSTTPDKYILVAGERRIRAMQRIEVLGGVVRHGTQTFSSGRFPALTLGELSDNGSFEAELAENIVREDLTWQERAQAEARLHSVRQAQAAKLGQKHPISHTTQEIASRRNMGAPIAAGSTTDDISMRIHLAKHLDDPEVAAAKTQKEAAKIVRSRATAQENASAAAKFDTLISPHTLFEGDFFEQIANVPDESVDILLTDPPYGIDANNFGEQAGVAHNYEDSHEYLERIMATLSAESERFCKPRAHAYIFCDPRKFSAIQLQFELSGWNVWPIPLIWAKGNGMLPRPEHAPRRTYETILFASRGDKPVKCVRGDVITIPAVRNLQHGAQKPVELYLDLLSRSASPGNSIFDPFAGSGTIFTAAREAKVIATGIELDQSSIDLCKLAMAGTTQATDGLADLDI